VLTIKVEQLHKKIVHRILRFSLLDQASYYNFKNFWRFTMKWETPNYTDLRFGFEVTMYIYNR